MKIKTWILLAALVLLAIPAMADDSQMLMQEEIAVTTDESWGGSYEIGTYMENPCTAVEDWVLVDYNVFLEQGTFDGVDRYIFDESASLSSSSYYANGTALSDVTYSTPYTLRTYHKVNTADDFHVVTLVDFYPSTRETYVSVETACGDGTPSSSQ